jgi:predicted aconitase
MMILTSEETAILNGEQGKATQKAMEILIALGTIYKAERMIPVSSVQVSGVSYANLGEAGLEYLLEMAANGGKARILTTLNPAGMDIENWEELGISKDFAQKQQRVLEAFAEMNIITTCSCTPYLFGNTPHYGEHIAWAESSAVCYANSVIGARTNREGGPSALAASITGRTPNYGFHLVKNRKPDIFIQVNAQIINNRDFGALGHAIAKKFEGSDKKPVPYIRGIPSATIENLKSFCASIATFGGIALFLMEDITPEAQIAAVQEKMIELSQSDLNQSIEALNSTRPEAIDFVSLGCPHLSIKEIARIAELLHGKQVRKEFWLTTARPTKNIADRMGYTKIIEESGAKFAADTCCVVAPIKGRFKSIGTDSAKACYYAYAKNNFQTVFLPFDEVVREALK